MNRPEDFSGLPPQTIAYLRALHALNNVHVGLLADLKQLREWVEEGNIPAAMAYLNEFIKRLEDMR